MALLGQKVNTYVFCQILANSPIKGLYSFWFLLVMYESTSFPAALPKECAIIFFFFPNFPQSSRWQIVYQCSFNLHFSNYKWDWTSLHILRQFLYLFVSCLFISFSLHFFLLVFAPLFLSFRVLKNIGDISPLSVMYVANIFSQFVSYLFTCLWVFFFNYSKVYFYVVKFISLFFYYSWILNQSLTAFPYTQVKKEFNHIFSSS